VNSQPSNDDSDDDEPDGIHDTRKARAEARDETVLELLAEGMTHAEAAAFAGCSVRTVQRRLLDDAFARELTRRRAIRLDDITGRLSRITDRAIDAIEDTLEIGNPTLRFRAAQAVISAALRMRDELEIERRLQRLETQADHQNTPQETFPRWTTPIDT